MQIAGRRFLTRTSRAHSLGSKRWDAPAALRLLRLGDPSGLRPAGAVGDPSELPDHRAPGPLLLRRPPASPGAAAHGAARRAQASQGIV